MRARLPSFVALRAFESAARLGSFKAAAQELSVTPTAVSHQIRALEEQLEISLFSRKIRGIELTEAGQEIAPVVTRAVADIAYAINVATAKNNTITISTTPSFATLFLVPRLVDFSQRYPQYKVQLHTTTQLVDLHLDRHVDLAIRYGSKEERGIECTPLLVETFGAYVSPSVTLSDLELHKSTLIQTVWQQNILGSVHWQAWFSAAGIGGEVPNVIGFEEEAHVLQAAIAGKGIALASSVLASDLVDRQLLKPFRPDIQLPGHTYNMMRLSGVGQRKKIRDFLDWFDLHLSQEK